MRPNLSNVANLNLSKFGLTAAKSGNWSNRLLLVYKYLSFRPNTKKRNDFTACTKWQGQGGALTYCLAPTKLQYPSSHLKPTHQLTLLTYCSYTKNVKMHTSLFVHSFKTFCHLTKTTNLPSSDSKLTSSKPSLIIYIFNPPY